MDEKFLEQADAIATSMIEAGIRAAGAKQKCPDDFKGTCSCGAEIPAGRLAHCFYNCVDCQSVLERHNKLRRSG